MPPTFTLSLPLNRRDVLISVSTLTTSFAFPLGMRMPRGPPPATRQKENTPGLCHADDGV